MSEQKDPDSPPPAAASPSSAADNIIKVLAAVTILALIAQGLIMLRSQVTHLSNLRPKRTRPPRSATQPDGTKRPDFKPIQSATGSRFAAAIKKYKPKETPKGDLASLGAGGTGPHTKDSLIEAYRTMYNKQGIRDEEYIIVMALDQADCGWSAAVSAAQRALDAKNYEQARAAVKEALERLDERHLFARGRLLRVLSNIEFRAADPEAGRAVQREADELSIELAKILIKGASERTGSTISAEEADDLIAGLSDERDQKDAIGQVSMVFSGQGQDPDKAPERIMAMLRTVIEHGDKGL